ncbi:MULTISPECIES: DNA polymerase III subunit beta [Bradyrhizobium]|uniref:DNA polymerase III subunit beta n=1 Tax=Bradyrhizobium elkanii TaxID=29448 RepID=UPI0018AD5A5A|nr:DNA polymerase III subunit beta [Bradyrhizobium elkanii]
MVKRGADSGVAHLATTGDAISITCTDKAVGTIATSVSATIHEPGETALSIGRLAALLSSLAANAIVEIEATARTINVTCGSSRIRLAAVPLVELPTAIAIVHEIGRIEIGCADGLRLLEPLAVADSGRSRPYLAGVFWHSVQDQLVAVSTDGIRLIRTAVAASTFSEDRTLIVPTEAAIAVRRLLQKAGASRVTLRRSRSLIAFDAPCFSFTARLIDGGFPSYESRIPPPASNSVLCNRLDLLAALSRLSAAALSNDIALVALSWGTGGCLDLYLARCPLDGADVVAADVRGSAKVALSLPQLAALLKEFDSDHIQLETENGQPLVVRDAGKLALIGRSKWNFGDCGATGGQAND